MTLIYEDDYVQLHHGRWQDASIEALGGEKVDAIITDPPYGETSLEWDRWPKGWPAEAARLTNALWCFGSFRMFHDKAPEFADWKFSHEIVWEKQNGTGFATDKFRRVHELATFWYRGPWEGVRHSVPRIPAPPGVNKSVRKRGQTPHTGKIGDTGYTDDGMRLTPSVMRVPNEQSRAVHPTQKPEGIIAPLIEYSVPSGGVVVDLFAGSGTTALVARSLGRRCIAFEAREDYAHAAAQRLSQQAFIFPEMETA